MPAKTPELQKAAQQRHYKANKTNEIRKAGERKRANQVILRQAIAEAKSVPCADCGCEYPAPVMDFHHLGEKDGPIALMVARNVSLERLWVEIAKCVILCANCHRIRTYCSLEE